MLRYTRSPRISTCIILRTNAGVNWVIVAGKEDDERMREREREGKVERVSLECGRQSENMGSNKKYYASRIFHSGSADRIGSRGGPHSPLRCETKLGW